MSLAMQLQAGLRELHLDLSPEQRQKLLDYLQLLLKWNRTFNLTAIRDPREMVNCHVLDSLSILELIWPGRWLDVGSGAGLPGLILAIVKPEDSFVLLDSNSKKTSFIQQAVVELGLKNVTVVTSRIENWQTEQRFDGIVTRALTDIPRFIQLTHPFLAAGGGWVAMKGKSEKIELNHIDKDCVLHEVRVPGIAAARCLVIIRATNA